MKFAHFADCHIGAWRDSKLRDLSIEAFINAVNIAMDHEVDFVLIAGDLFNTALPNIDNLKSAVKQFQVLKDKNIPVYIIPGSHDYSPSGKTMIDVLEEAQLLTNVVKGSVVDGKLQLKFTTDKKTGTKITGILGLRGSLDKNYYENLDLENLEKEDGFKIFMFHAAISELMPSSFSAMNAMSINAMPKGFDYYAGGHVHIIKEYSEKDYKNVIYPGPLFPASFSELESLSSGGFYIYDDGKLIREDINIKNTFIIDIDANHKSVEEVENIISQKLLKKELINTIVLLRVSGKLKSGKTSDIKFKEITSNIYSQGAYFVLRNTSKLSSEEFEEIQIEEKSVEEVEEALITEHLGQIKVKGMDAEKETSMTKSLIAILSSEKHEGEKVYEYEERIKKETDRLLGI